MKQWMVLFTGLFFILSAYSEGQCTSCGDDCGCGPSCECEHPPRAPAGVMGDHTHHQGGWMVSYRYMAMNMEGLSDGDTSGYMMLPVEMNTQMHMLGAMYAPMDRLTLAMMVPYIIKDMDGTRTMMGNTTAVSSHTEGLGDIKLAGMYELWSSPVQQLLLNIALSLPTGSIDETNDAGQRLAYPMQLGSGSYGFLPGVTYTGLKSGWGWGAQAKAAIPLNENDHDYTLGNRYDLQCWGLRDITSATAISLRLHGWHRENIDGADPTLNPAMSPGADPEQKAATRLDLLAGMDYRVKMVRLALEAGAPLYQELEGLQLEGQWMVMGGLQLSF